MIAFVLMPLTFATEATNCAALRPGQGADLLETRGWDDLASGVIKSSYSWSSSFLTAAIWRSSNSVKRRPRQRSAARMSRAEHEFEHRLFAEAVGDDFEPSPLLDEEPFEQVGRPGEAPMRDRQAQVGDAGPEVAVKTGERARKDIGVVGADARRQLARDRPRGRPKGWCTTRGVDILIAIVDGLKGFPEAIVAVFLQVTAARQSE